jgi:hypothetical protein
VSEVREWSREVIELSDDFHLVGLQVSGGFHLSGSAISHRQLQVYHTIQMHNDINFHLSVQRKPILPSPLLGQ